MTKEQFVTELKKLVKILNSSIPTETDPLYNFVCEEIIDRVIIYLNYQPNLDDNGVDDIYDRLFPLIKIMARVVNGLYIKSKADSDNGGVEQGINSMSDNGQSINFSEKAKLYLNTSSDQDIFSGFTDLLNTYRLANVL